MDDEFDIICGCSGTTVGQIKKLLDDGVLDIDRISRITGTMSGCGGCEFDVQEMLDNHQAKAEEN
jgi:NAD(P)H-nitrite reductase